MAGMKNITIALDARSAARLRVLAARAGKSVSRFVGEVLEGHMQDMRDYNSAMRRFLTRPTVRLKGAGESYTRREELHDRASLR